MNFIHCPQVNPFAFCQSAKFFLPGPDLRRSRWQSKVAVSATETRADETAAGIVVCRDSPSIAFLHTPIGSYHPISSPSDRSSSAACVVPLQCLGFALDSTAAAAPTALLQSGRSNRQIQNVGPNKPRFAEHLPRALRLGGNSCLALPAVHRGAGGRNVIPRSVGFRPVVRELQFLHLVSLVALLCHQDTIMSSHAQLLMSLCINMDSEIASSISRHFFQQFFKSVNDEVDFSQDSFSFCC